MFVARESEEKLTNVQESLRGKRSSVATQGILE